MMKQIAHFANGDRNEMARKLADGIHPMVIWFSAGVAAAYDKDGNIESRWEERCPLNDGEERYILEENELVEDAAQFVEVENPSPAPAWPDESTTETLENIHGDLAVIYYWDDSFEYDACRGYEIYLDGDREKGQGLVTCGNADTAYAILSRKGFRY